MSASITNAFEKKYSDDVHHLFTQRGSKLRDSVRFHSGVKGSTYDFHRLGTLTAASRAAGSSAEVTGLDATSSTVTATLADWEVPIYAQKFDQLKTSVDQVKEYQVETVTAMGKRLDDTIITALNTATTTLTTTAGGLTYAKLLEAVTFFNSNDVPEEDRYFVLGAKQLSDALAIQQLTSGDYMAIGAIMNAGVGKALGMNWIMSTRLPLNTTNRTCFAFNKKAVGVAMGMDITTEINYIPQRVSHLINTMGSFGAVVIDQTGIAKMTCSEA